jgi:pimeloyl-ACP methyl ester carboxylesterase
MVDIGERALFMDCRGSGSPTVVLEAGLSGSHKTWDAVAPRVREETRVCSYDRANVGRSDRATTPRTAREIVGDLHTALRAADERPPFLLVGFSFGGLTTQLYAASYPGDVAGVVLVDSNHPDETGEFEAHLTQEQIKKDRAYVNDNAEGVDVFTSFEQVQAADGFPDVPLVVVTAGISEGWPPGWDTELFDRLRAAQQENLAKLSPQGTQVVARNSSHDIPAQQPQVVVDAIQTVLNEMPSQ